MQYVGTTPVTEAFALRTLANISAKAMSDNWKGGRPLRAEGEYHHIDGQACRLVGIRNPSEMHRSGFYNILPWDNQDDHDSIIDDIIGGWAFAPTSNRKDYSYVIFHYEPEHLVDDNAYLVSQEVFEDELDEEEQMSDTEPRLMMTIGIFGKRSMLHWIKELIPIMTKRDEPTYEHMDLRIGWDQDSQHLITYIFHGTDVLQTLFTTLVYETVMPEWSPLAQLDDHPENNASLHMKRAIDRWLNGEGTLRGVRAAMVDALAGFNSKNDKVLVQDLERLIEIEGLDPTMRRVSTGETTESTLTGYTFKHPDFDMERINVALDEVTPTETN